MKDNTIILMYHDIYRISSVESGFQNPGAQLYKLSIQKFEEQVSNLASLQSKNLVLSFDDGGESAYSIAAPILEEHGLRGIFFISTDYIGKTGFLNNKKIKELHERGHVIASHTHTHPSNLTDLTEKEIEEEWITSLIMLSNIIGVPIDNASIPNGYSSAKVIKVASKVGIKTLYNSSPTTKICNQNGCTIIGRYAITNKMSNQFVLSILHSNFVRMQLRIKWILLNVLKKLFRNYYIFIREKILKR